MSSASSTRTILLLGGTGKVSSRIAPLLSSNGYSILLASRSGKAPSLPNCYGIKFDWSDESTYSNPFTAGSISTIFIVAPPVVDQLPLAKSFIDLAISKGVKRFVLLSATVFSDGSGPMMGAISKYIVSLGVEYAILCPSWFMENFSELGHFYTILNQDRIVTATGDGKVPFVSANDIAAVAYRALTDEVPHNKYHLILGPQLYTYDEVAEMITKSLGRKITHVQISEDEETELLHGFGLPEDYARVLAQLDTYISEGKEEIQNDTVFEVTGKQPVRLEDFIGECVSKNIWAKQ